MTPQNVLPLQEATDQAANWRELANNAFGTGYIKGFKLSMVNFTQIQDSGADSIRVYLGVTNDGEKRLLMVGVDSNGDDMIDYDNGQYVYNLTTACPPGCGTANELNS